MPTESDSEYTKKGRTMHDSGTVRVIATLVARQGKADELGEVLRGLVVPTLAEAGCLRYELWQSEADPREFRFLEEWESAAALEAHFATPHIEAALERFAELLAGDLDLRRYRLVS